MSDISNNTNFPNGTQNTNNPKGTLRLIPGQILASWHMNPVAANSHWATAATFTNGRASVNYFNPDIVYRFKGQFNFETTLSAIYNINVSVQSSYNGGTSTALPGLQTSICAAASANNFYESLTFDEYYRPSAFGTYTFGVKFTENTAQAIIFRQGGCSFTVDAVYLPKNLCTENASSDWTSP